MISVVLLLALIQLPDSPGKSETVELCAECHGLERIASLQRDSAGWQKTIDKMTILGLTASDEQIAAVLNYLSRNFAKINVNTATREELKATLALTSIQADALLDYRNRHGNFKSLAELKKVPALNWASLKSKQDRIDF